MRCSPTILAGAFLSVVAAGQAAAEPIAYTGELQNRTAAFGAVSPLGEFNSPESELSDYWRFSATAGASMLVFALRTEPAFDPALWVFSGTISDTSHFAGGFSAAIDELDPGFLAFADDEIPFDFGPFDDPLTRLIAPSTGPYTIIVTNASSGPDDGDGRFPYVILASASPVPEPATLGVLGLGVLGAAAARRHRSARRLTQSRPR
jgi:hypothetical protein